CVLRNRAVSVHLAYSFDAGFHGSRNAVAKLWANGNRGSASSLFSNPAATLSQEAQRVFRSRSQHPPKINHLPSRTPLFDCRHSASRCREKARKKGISASGPYCTLPVEAVPSVYFLHCLYCPSCRPGDGDGYRLWRMERVFWNPQHGKPCGVLRISDAAI